MTMMRWFVALTPLAGAIIFPLVVPLSMARFGLGAGVLVALIVGSIWFVTMLRTAEMPH
ncbi:MAG TPA: hypothetical protein ACN46U_06250 [Prochlorococcus sp.]|jgi:hypothetical protein|nr:hypothetical protein [Prochlorococcaceae cyanobacterium ETNP18_MAG_14]HJM81012.1 hypothetical protein [Prochlorococcaceae cyanobacterium Fu_MAG_72]|tara:strand:- start:1238 stop:1414 length:177 start_codon:yes stop_codon:yes gene_type:complete